LRTTNALERINEEFRRRTKTQASLPSEEAVLFLLFGLLRSGQVTLRRLVGWRVCRVNYFCRRLASHVTVTPT